MFFPGTNSATMTFFPSMFTIHTSNDICGSMESFRACVMESLVLNTSSSGIPDTSPRSSTPKRILPPEPLANAIAVLTYLASLDGLDTLNSRLSDSPFEISLEITADMSGMSNPAVMIRIRYTFLYEPMYCMQYCKSVHLLVYSITYGG